MTDQSATDRLREMLDERGEPYTTNDHMGAKETSWRGFTAYQLTPSSKLIMHPTPEQAIAATLGSGTCEIVSSRFDEMMDEWCIELSCGHCVWNRTEPPNYCEECGAKIRKAVGA